MNQQNLPNYGGYPTSLPTSTMATVSLIAGILGLFLFPLLGSIIALIKATWLGKRRAPFLRRLLATAWRPRALSWAGSKSVWP